MSNYSVRPCLKENHHKKGCGVAQGVGPEFKTRYCKKKKKVLSREEIHEIAETQECVWGWGLECCLLF
jgi:hypothetical protein